jgi:hypothetical protein
VAFARTAKRLQRGCPISGREDGRGGHAPSCAGRTRYLHLPSPSPYRSAPSPLAASWCSLPPGTAGAARRWTGGSTTSRNTKNVRTPTSAHTRVLRATQSPRGWMITADVHRWLRARSSLRVRVNRVLGAAWELADVWSCGLLCGIRGTGPRFPDPPRGTLRLSSAQSQT